MTRAGKTFTISLPSEMAEQVKEIAKEENRNLSELFREAIRVYQQEREIKEIRRVQHLLKPKLAAKGILTEEQIDKLIYEDR